jgi:hypothetical protein
MTGEEFLANFWSNFFADFIVGILIGIGVTIWVNRKLAKEEDNRKRGTKLFESHQKQFDYLQAIKSDIEFIQKKVSSLLSLKEIPPFIHIDTAFWEILKTGSEVPILFIPKLTQVLSKVYSTANEVNEINSRKSLAKTKVEKEYFLKLEMTTINRLKEMIFDSPKLMDIIDTAITDTNPEIFSQRLHSIINEENKKKKFLFFK